MVSFLVFWQDIPNTIAIHFTNGEPDNYGSKYLLLFMPVIGLFMWWLLGKLTHNPQKLNYINLTEKNKKKQYRMAVNMLITIQNLSFMLFLFANEALLRYAAGASHQVFFALSLALLFIILLTLFYNLIWATSLKE
ncbi:SdpI family protein [Sutcliffiella rhizosphaerae]|uniref:DUF1648 domain-containing protein n=1 Tax=Sutcliffiella rhizosphaerae TaxID=2880967 RepID=A0ABM8YKB2_9BACI|nr:DUF1648 domain-containing protein [Sutcliffiella rhizosphaerae]CAG9620378.1 hypothetical protein BACCIP111883_01146 [Sutcliffiella rhizosphaerae]